MRSKELWLVEKNHAPVKPDSSVASHGMKTYRKSIIELQNLQILKKMLEKSSQFLSSEQPCESKSFDVALKIAGVEKVPLENLWLRSIERPFDSSFEWIERSANDGDFCLLICGWWFPNQFDIVSQTHLSRDTVGGQLWLAIVSLLLCPETDRNIHIRKQGYVFILSDFKKWCFDVSFLT